MAAMLVDLAPASGYEAAALYHPSCRPTESMPIRRPTILVFDSGLGGLTVYAEVAKLCPGAAFVYAADDAGFPYGAWREPELVARIVTVVGGLIRRLRPDVVVIACNTASTLVLPNLRGAFPAVPFVGTVPAIKPAAAQSRSRLISVLATPGTVARDYTRALIDSFAGDCRVTLVGSTRLASLTEAAMAGAVVPDREIAAELTPCFVEEEGRRTDCIVLACTHYPLLLARFEELAPWPVTWIDPAPAIARRVDALLRERGFACAPTGDITEGAAVFTSGRVAPPALRATLAHYRLAEPADSPSPE